MLSDHIGSKGYGIMYACKKSMYGGNSKSVFLTAEIQGRILFKVFKPGMNSVPLTKTLSSSLALFPTPSGISSQLLTSPMVSY